MLMGRTGEEVVYETVYIGKGYEGGGSSVWPGGGVVFTAA